MLTHMVLIQRIFVQCPIVLVESLSQFGFLGRELPLLAHNVELCLSHHLLVQWSRWLRCRSSIASEALLHKPLCLMGVLDPPYLGRFDHLSFRVSHDCLSSACPAVAVHFTNTAMQILLLLLDTAARVVIVLVAAIIVGFAFELSIAG